MGMVKDVAAFEHKQKNKTTKNASTLSEASYPYIRICLRSNDDLLRLLAEPDEPWEGGCV